jgi:uncharacterized membrane protein YoaK (UPF0700 family)
MPSPTGSPRAERGVRRKVADPAGIECDADRRHAPAAHATPSDAMTVDRIVAVLLGFTAGYVDGCTFVALFGLFVAQVTGSFVIAGAMLVVREPGALVKVLAIPAFLIGAAVTTVLASVVRGPPQRVAALALGLESLLLVGLLASGTFAPIADPDQPLAVLASLFGLGAMGVQSAFVRLFMHAVPSTNVMTTNTTQVAIDATALMLARIFRRNPQRLRHAVEPAQARFRLAQTLPVMLAFLVGTVAGAATCHQAGLFSLVLPILILLGLTARAARSAA